jgi:NDP-sugar pyrophosphorylase family protein
MPVPQHGLLLTAGLGTRLKPLTLVRAKPAIPVAGDPLARRIVRWLVSHGVTRLVANLHHLPETLTAVLGDGSDMGASIRYSWELPEILGSAGGPRQALAIVGSETFVIVNGDVLTDVDLPRLADQHSASGALATLALVPNTEPLRYGGVKVTADGTVSGFAARGPAAAGSWHFVGVQMVEASLFRPLTAGRPASSIGGLYDRLIAERPGSVRAFRSDARYWDIGTVADYWRTWFAFQESPAAGPRTILWDDVEIARGASLDECIVTDGVRVPAGAVYRRQVLIKDAAGHIVAMPFAIED